jgi:hypothetical protein
MLDPVIHNSAVGNTWFKADIPLVYANIIDLHSNHYRTKVHQLFALTGFFPVYLIKVIPNDSGPKSG